MADRRAQSVIGATAAIHAGGMAATMAGIVSWETLLAGIAVNHLVLGAASMVPRCAWLGPNMTRLPETAKRGLISLTFDDGPDPDVTPRVLDLLRQANARATFFCIGSRVDQHPHLIETMRAQGHGVENHTHTHPNTLALRGPGPIAHELRLAQRAIEAAGGGRPTLFRAPAGMKNPWMGTVISKEGLMLVTWTRRGFDTVSRSGARVAARLVRGLRERDILLLHDGAAGRTLAGGVVLDALPRVLDEMHKRNLQSERLNAR